MTLATFARMCEVLEGQTPTQKAITIDLTMYSVGPTALQEYTPSEDKVRLIQILSMEYPINNIGNKRAVTWIANALGVFEDELESYMHTWGEIGEAVAELDEGNETDSEITLTHFLTLLSMDCSRIESNSYTLFAESLNKMSAREKKWFIRYWLRKPRNGVNNKVPLKAMMRHYDDKDIPKYAQYNSATIICRDLDAGIKPACVLVHGHFIPPMLAKARKGSERPRNYMIDIKYDGNRYQIHKSGMSVAIFNRKGNLVTDQFHDVVAIVKGFDVEDIILDTEIYPVHLDGSPAPHKLMAKRVHKINKSEAARECPVKMAAFDVLSRSGEALIERPLRDRLSHLTYIPPEYRAETLDINGSIQAAYNLAIDKGFEGIMIKDTDMIYQAGKRSKGWLKYKPPRMTFDVVITSAKYGEGKRSQVYGTYGISVKDGPDYVPVGKCGNGFSDRDLDELTTELKKSVESMDGEWFKVLPRIVLEVTCELVTNDSDGNIGLRFPRCTRIRHDKFAADCDTLESVKEMM